MNEIYFVRKINQYVHKMIFGCQNKMKLWNYDNCFITLKHNNCQLVFSFLQFVEIKMAADSV